MDGVGGYAGWRWIFILEGLFTVIVGILSFWIIQGGQSFVMRAFGAIEKLASDFPESAKFLTTEERKHPMRASSHHQLIFNMKGSSLSTD